MPFLSLSFFFNLGPACRHFAVFLSSAGHFSTKNNQTFQELLTYSKILKKKFCLSIVFLIAFSQEIVTKSNEKKKMTAIREDVLVSDILKNSGYQCYV